MDFAFILYILVSIGIGIGGTMALVNNDRTLGAFLYFVGSILILTFYGLRWFAGDSFRTTRYSTKTWPPVINTCPDFLSYYEIKEGKKTRKVCVDLIGIASEGKLKKLTSQNQATDPTYQFNLHMDKQGRARNAALCQECKEKGVTWEGIYDGISCVATVPTPTEGGGNSAENPTC